MKKGAYWSQYLMRVTTEGKAAQSFDLLDNPTKCVTFYTLRTNGAARDGAQITVEVVPVSFSSSYIPGDRDAVLAKMFDAAMSAN